MSDETNPAVETEEVQEEVQTVTAEQFEDLKKQLEETKRAQSGSDRTVAELRKQLEQAERAKSEAEKSAEEKMAERLASIEKKLEQAETDKARLSQRSAAIERLTNEGLKAPKYLDRLIGRDDEETQELIDAYIEEKKADALNANAEYAKTHGRKVYDTKPSTWDGLTYKDLQAMPTEEFNRVPTEIIDKLTNAALENRR